LPHLNFYLAGVKSGLSSPLCAYEERTEPFFKEVMMSWPLKFRSDLICGLLKNEGDCIGKLVRAWNTDTPITLCQGYGVGKSVPLRLLAYAVPMLRLARQLPRRTRIEFYWATNGVLRANPNYDLEYRARWQVLDASKHGRKFLKNYVTTFHPDLQMQVNILEDRNPCQRGREATLYLLQEAIAVARESKSIGSFIEQRGGVQALQYMAEHAMYMRDPLMFEGEPLPELVDSRTYPNWVFGENAHLPQGGHLVMIGGQAERIFWKLRQELLRKLPTHELWTSHQFFTGVGDPPTYHPQRAEPYADIADRPYEPDLPTILVQAKTVGSGVLHDWLVLLQDAAGVERFTITSQTMNGASERAVLQEGLSRLHDWLRPNYPGVDDVDSSH